ncbi:hypothetical protein E3N88_09651 [Mikania micrantha]|uniref:PGG domain-containing protein n=1 Tax=Mikania micrantha TaxID=192012 RepID=A0A5N6PMR5_9ASTR|nr:hypothetical protein E3N88_09651 [Mikania micrantha]
METDTIIYLLDHYSVTPHLENGEMFDGTQIVVKAISSKDYVSAYKMRSFIKDPDTVLMAIAQNCPSEVSVFTATRQDAVWVVKEIVSRLPPENKLKPTYGAALQMQNELKWFKAVERFVSPLNVIQKNSFGETPQMVFTKEHKKLAIEGEKWMKETAQSYTIIAALITTIMFAAAITVPRGNKQDNGLPMFTNNNIFILFAILDGISFVTSAASLMMFMSILTHRFYEQDFFYILPTKLERGVGMLLISTVTMVFAFSVAFSLVYFHQIKWLIVLISLLLYPAFSWFFWKFEAVSYMA